MNISRSARFDTYADYRAGIAELLELTTQTLTVYDADLSATGLESPAACSVLERLCRESRREDAIRILLRTPRHLERDCPRLLRLLEHYGHRVSVRVRNAAGNNMDEGCFIVADGRHLITRFHSDAPRGKLLTDAGPECTPYLVQFEPLWVAGRPGPSGGRVGL
ncbi:MAG: hypothetical protein ACK4KV_10620 [Rhodocyclaceae bacterium]